MINLTLRWEATAAAAAALAFVAAACSPSPETTTPETTTPETTATETTGTADDAAPAADATVETASAGSASEAVVDDGSLPALDGAALARRVEELASDRFEGRAPASPGGQAASQWVADEMAAIGLEPAGENGTYFQAVPLSRSKVDLETSSFGVTTADGAAVEMSYGPDVVFWTKKTEPEVTITDSELVFVGYGVVAPEYGWNDYEGLDVAGKTVVMLVNDPGYATGDPELFNGEAMTYYGRWTYKYEEAGRQGAAAAIVVHETAPASYPWAVVQGSWSGEQFDLVRPDGGADRVGIEGWVTHATAERLFEAAGLDYETLKTAAKEPGFAAVPMTGLSLDAVLHTDLATLNSRNVAGVLRGTEAPDEYVLMTAHWDHLGMRDAPEGEDAIFNGAVDNATGVAGILTIAEALAEQGAPRRSVLALAVTAEESGLLGSEYFATDPLVPLKDIVAGLNIDAMLPIGRSRDIVVVGFGASELEDILARHAAEFDKVLSPDPNPSAGSFYRSDHISIAKRGVPMIYADGGEELRDGGAPAGAAAEADYRAERYHKPSDEYDPETWNLEGILEDLTIDRNFVEEIANSDAWPNWYEGNEFRALRDAQRAGD